MTKLLVLAGMMMLGQQGVGPKTSLVQDGSGDVNVTYPIKDKDFAFSTRITSLDLKSPLGRVVLIDEDEYARLQVLQKALADEEVKIAKVHGVAVEPYQPQCTPSVSGICFNTDHIQPADRYEFRGQFLLINVPDAKEKP